MNIVFLAPFGIRPKGTLIARMLPLAVQLQALGHRVTIVAPPYTNPEDSGRTEVVDGVTIRNISLGGGGKLAAPLVYGYRMIRLARSERPDLVHLFKPKGYGGMAAFFHLWGGLFRERNVPLFVDTDDWEGRGGMNSLHDYSRPEKAVFAIQERWLPRLARGVTVASRTLQTQVWGMGLPAERVLYLPNGVDDKKGGDGARVRDKHGIPAEGPVVLLYTRFFEFEQERLHRVLTQLAAQRKDISFLVVGKGRNREEDRLQDVAERCGFADRLVMAGWVQPEEIPDYLAAADVALYPLDDTLYNRSKCPAKLTEIIRAGCPVVADRVGQVAEYLPSDRLGITCSPGDVQDMVDGVLDLLAHPAKRRRMGRAARHHLLENFSWRGAAGELDRFYRRCLG
ncbi:glycosyltransferase involved in cell wall biosynthesis [Geothermobacter ehrlichii]|uniref:Glycosyltransferase involved in cell wall biosynthesis n=1 Tax=Geothermobacter ehrlichii TaxID=213224 RepID=A0A5D3WF14_9BACT|nr:glycosyltransferase family 4 protein [Geothermobacter ehrlichii]TYO96062.1 glycosyltransferase involved in cell wall biosynthesis [Geothermobacter ehrlichii]